MKTLLLTTTIIITIATNAFANPVAAYQRHDGTYVQPYQRTAPDNTRNDNYSTRGNTNPYTGQQGNQPRDEDQDFSHKGSYGY